MLKSLNLTYDEIIENSINEIVKYLKAEYVLSKRSIALLLLQGDTDMMESVKKNEGSSFVKISGIVNEVKKHYDKPLNYIVSLNRQKKVEEITDKYVKKTDKSENNITDLLSRITMNPITGIPILLLVLYFGLYKFVGEFGAGTIVDFLEADIFEAYINPWVNSLVTAYIPWHWLQELIAREYGIVTLGIRYAVAIILPIVGTFFIAFSIIEDTGYLPRLALLVDRIFKKIGLNGRAVIPMTLGFGCDTMATMVSRTLETKRERVIATLLLALAIPCSAQLGVILALLSGQSVALVVWVVFVALVFLFIGFLTSKLMPGSKPSFYMEVPPLRLPKLSNVLVKTYTRIQWYFVEILPLFIVASVLIWFGNLTGLFDYVISLMEPLVNFVGLPDEAAEAFLFGFFRRDYGAAGLYDLQKAGALSPRQLAVAASTLTLFVPCIAQFSMTIKERGTKAAIAMAAFIFPFAFVAGFVLNWVLVTFKVLP
ncbi:ferrous iron transport protein B [Geosporobacter subterraneus DSM 17957]|uniref:Ferrous iron transport protein B n=1 Tax=Geosporobacter subterraneus DSM 17957 TaxID=1121919 RepID=A0A1M6HMB8_9FIRM|nr:ferrous iron transporter B [Geosporobacter subterraneus]SHJ23310.1 ferrous iron transport protein B [Geosporobacter subterraneus DSM 17957]